MYVTTLWSFWCISRRAVSEVCNNVMNLLVYCEMSCEVCDNLMVLFYVMQLGTRSLGSPDKVTFFYLYIARWDWMCLYCVRYIVRWTVSEVCVYILIATLSVELWMRYVFIFSELHCEMRGMCLYSFSYIVRWAVSEVCVYILLSTLWDELRVRYMFIFS